MFIIRCKCCNVFKKKSNISTLNWVKGSEKKNLNKTMNLTWEHFPLSRVNTGMLSF